MKRALLTAFLVPAVGLIGCAGNPSDVGEGEQAVHGELNRVHLPDQASFFARTGGGGTSNLSYHNGPVIHAAHVVPIFWGPSWGSGGSDASNASTIQAYIANYGLTSHYAVITQYYDTTGKIQASNLAGGPKAYFDSSTPPANVTDAIVQSEVNKAIAAVGFDASAIYEVFLPTTSYSSDGTSTSCGGPSLAYCAYHGHFTGNGGDTKYGSMPYPSCSGCQSAGFSTVQNIEHFISHETREAVTDEDGNAWYDRRGNEADDKCAWSPAPFTDSNGYAYQYEWSNAVSGCVQ
jgi:hypothetical protein